MVGEALGLLLLTLKLEERREVGERRRGGTQWRATGESMGSQLTLIATGIVLALVEASRS